MVTDKVKTGHATEERARLEGTLALTPIVVTPDELMIIARKMHEEARSRAQAKQKIYHRLSSSVILIYDPGLTLVSASAPLNKQLPGTDVSALLEKSILTAVQNEDPV